MKKTKKEKIGNIFRQFTITQVIESIESQNCFDDANELALPACDRSSEREGRETFYATSSMGETLELLRNGWDERPLHAESIDGATAGQYSEAVSTVHSVQGSFPDVAAFLNGEPECMIDFHIEHNPRIVRVGVNIAAPGIMEHDSFHARGACTLAICDALARGGYGVEIFALNSSKDLEGHNACLDYAIEIKKSNEPLDMDSLAFWACHPAAFRRIGFALRERESQAVRTAFHIENGGGYGYAGKYDADRTGLPIDILIDDSHMTPGTMQRYIDEALKPYFEGVD